MESKRYKESKLKLNGQQKPPAKMHTKLRKLNFSANHRLESTRNEDNSIDKLELQQEILDKVLEHKSLKEK